MSVGYTPETFGLLIVLAFAGVVVVGVAWRVLRGVLRRLGVKNDGWALLMLAALVASAALAGSLALDTIGERASAVVTSRRETVFVTRRGGWNRTYQVGARATGADASAGATPVQLLTLSPSEARYDTLVEGDHFDVRMLRAGTLSVIRDARDSTRTLLPWTWLAAAAAAVLALVVLWRFAASLVVVAVVASGVVLPLVNAYRDAQTANDLTSMTAHATVTVHEVTRVSEWRLTSQNTSRGADRAFDDFDLPQHYDVVELEFTPPGARGSVLAVDAVDVPSGSAPVLAKGARVDLRYVPGAPRDVRLDGHTRRWHWRDMVAVYRQIWLVLAVLTAGLLVWAWASRKASAAGRALRSARRGR